MNTIITFVKRLRLARIVVIFLAGIVLLVNTACSQPSSAKTSKMNNPGYNQETQNPSGYETEDNVVLKGLKESYKTVPPEGGMNQHRDVDRRKDNTASDARSQDLVNRAEDHLQKSVRNPKEAADNLRNDVSVDKIKNKFGDLSKNVNDSTRQIKEGTEKGLDDLKTNLKSTVDQVSDNVQRAVR